MGDRRLKLFRWGIIWEEKTIIAGILSQEQGKSTEDLAHVLAELAKSHSLDDKYCSPFAELLLWLKNLTREEEMIELQ
ncbi:peptidase M20/M25/M40 family protein [Salix suchowensis]|nr:peptidase M20/M25/M40 family protein [Salix suchowensis]